MNNQGPCGAPGVHGTDQGATPAKHEDRERIAGGVDAGDRGGPGPCGDPAGHGQVKGRHPPNPKIGSAPLAGSKPMIESVHSHVYLRIKADQGMFADHIGRDWLRSLTRISKILTSALAIVTNSDVWIWL